MEIKIVDGYEYHIQYKRELSQREYTQKLVYHIKTEDESFPHVHRAVSSIMDDGSWTKGLWLHKNKVEPCMTNGLHSYHEFTFNEDLDVFVYTLIIPWDD